MQFTFSVLTTLALAAGSMAHMKMKEPLQWGMGSPIASSPLAPDGSNFPCQGFAPEEVVATYEAGGTGTLTVIGGATHGGGSGQMVFTLDTGSAVTSKSVWKVMQSWEGDHPVKADGNTSGDSEESHPSIPFAIPSDISGKVVIAWNWFNRIGNREWYMKCATVEIKGSASAETTRQTFDTLPDMFRANVPAYAGSCHIPDSVSVIDFGAAAGSNLVVAPGATPERIEGCTVGSSTGGSTPTTPETPETPETPASPTSVPEEDDNSESGSGDSEELPSQPTQPVASPSPIAQPQPDNKGTSGSCVEGTTICSEGNTWSQCGSGMMQNMGPVPAGLTCSNGKLIAKRAVRFSAEHRHHRARHV